MTAVCPSVCLSVCPVPLPGPKSRTEGCSKLKTAKRKVHDTSDPRPHLEVKRSKIKIITRLNAITQNQSYLRNFKLETLYTDEVQDRQRRYGRCPQRSNKITVITSRRQFDACLPHNSTRKSRRNTDIGRMTLHTSSRVKRSKVKVTRRINDLGGSSSHHLLGVGRGHAVAASCTACLILIPNAVSRGIFKCITV